MSAKMLKMLSSQEANLKAEIAKLTKTLSQVQTRKRTLTKSSGEIVVVPRWKRLTRDNSVKSQIIEALRSRFPDGAGAGAIQMALKEDFDREITDGALAVHLTQLGNAGRIEAERFRRWHLSTADGPAVAEVAA
jgi:hypothetical protein